MGIEFADVNVLADPEIRQGIKDFSDWPTIPQLYVKDEFVGGCDIVTEMTLSGELDQLLEAKGVRYQARIENRFLGELLSWVLPFLLIIGLWMFFFRRMGNA